MRLFVAIDLPDEIKRELWYLALSLEHQAEQARVVPLENYHLTLLFLGETKRIAEAREALHQVRVPEAPIEVVFDGIGSFKQKRGYTWWVGVQVSEALAELQNNLTSRYRAAGFPLENRSFKPHITLARAVKTLRPVALEPPEHQLKANRISLMKSTPEAGHMVYTELDSLELWKNP